MNAHKYIVFFAATIHITLFSVHIRQKQVDFDQVAYDLSRTFAEVLQLTKQKHYNPCNIEDAMMKAIDTFLYNLDPHSNYIGPQAYTRMMEHISGEIFGIGVMIDNTRKNKDRHLTIVDTIPGGPADKAGVEPMDKIIEIDGKQLRGLETQEITRMLKGPRNTKVTITVMRKDKPDLLTFTITRDIIKDQSSLSFYIKDQNIYYLSLSMFSQNAIKQVEHLVDLSTQKKYKGLILDLRNNSGGLLNAVIDIAGLFIKKKSVVVTTKNNRNEITKTYTTNRDPIIKHDIPIFILINNYTASAAEILAGVLKEYAEQYKNSLRVFLVGTTTFGKGSVQEVIPISNNSAVKITTSLYFLPNDTTIQGKGIAPDFVIEPTMQLPKQVRWFTKNYGREQSFKHHIKISENTSTTNIKNKKGKKDNTSKRRILDRAKHMLQKDNQLRTTISLINFLDTARTTCPQQIHSRTQTVSFIKQHLITHDKKLTIELIQPSAP